MVYRLNATPTDPPIMMCSAVTSSSLVLDPYFAAVLPTPNTVLVLVDHENLMIASSVPNASFSGFERWRMAGSPDRRVKDIGVFLDGMYQHIRNVPEGYVGEFHGSDENLYYVNTQRVYLNETIPLTLVVGTPRKDFYGKIDRGRQYASIVGSVVTGS
ncbi:hypothetical protein HK104_001425 [Borealophlyctis nickersoniae]|nr:hypothetical protein HK104_001425 [Borealophlyctis nickersoniae]